MLKYINIILGAIIIIGIGWYIVGNGSGADEPRDAQTSATSQTTIPSEQTPMTETPQENVTVVMTTNKGAIVIELFTKESPITAGNFAKLVSEGFYDGTKFHRVINNFMIQGGDPNSKGDETATYGTGGPGYAIEDEFIEGLSNVRGTLSMANSGPQSGGSQFFINLVDNLILDFDKALPDGRGKDSKHPVFGRVIEGMEVVDSIAGVATGERDIPVEPVVVETVVVK